MIIHATRLVMRTESFNLSGSFIHSNKYLLENSRWSFDKFRKHSAKYNILQKIGLNTNDNQR